MARVLIFNTICLGDPGLFAGCLKTTVNKGRTHYKNVENRRNVVGKGFDKVTRNCEIINW